ncbi:MAG: prenyltransferase/squalene oxidase repeat-containing protein [Thermodesulfobacteriota bacterium]|nr:prenyltransferase/squalene oxidase repeat-containing protein [Thermodesulfobacteriota bacterium]
MERKSKRRALIFFLVISGLSCVGLGPMIFGAEPVAVTTGNSRSDLSLKNEVKHAIERGLLWLKGAQHPMGYWSQPDHPALTGLVLTGFVREPSGSTRAASPDFVKKGYSYLVQCVQPDGGIYVKDLANYNTAVSLMALIASFDPAYEPLIRNARNFLVGLQSDFGEKGKVDSPYDGGVGYGSRHQHSDMSNTMFALEALYYSQFVADDKEDGIAPFQELNWPGVIKFIQRCQNLPSHNDQAWASDDPENRGGFVYFPGNSKAGEVKLPSGKTALRSYGSISYAGLLSYIYADLDRDDPRVKAVFDWLRRNFTLEENPGMGPQGLYYYYHVMAKGLAAGGVHTLALVDGKEVDWRRELALKLLNLQKGEGFWVNENGRWWEKDPVLVTAYAILSLEIMHSGL